MTSVFKDNSWSPGFHTIFYAIFSSQDNTFRYSMLGYDFSVVKLAVKFNDLREDYIGVVKMMSFMTFDWALLLTWSYDDRFFRDPFENKG